MEKLSETGNKEDGAWEAESTKRVVGFERERMRQRREG